MYDLTVYAIVELSNWIGQSGYLQNQSALDAAARGFDTPDRTLFLSVGREMQVFRCAGQALPVSADDAIQPAGPDGTSSHPGQTDSVRKE